MQKLINALAIFSFGVSGCVVGGGAYVYLNKDALMEQAKEAAAAQIQDAIGGALGGSQLGQVLLGGPADDSESPVPLPAPMPSFPGM
jgi:hypothetical protein